MHYFPKDNIGLQLFIYKEFGRADLEFIKSVDNYQAVQYAYDLLWSVEEAVDDGFSCYVKTKTQHYNEAIYYHSKNCDGKTGCVVCKDLDSIGD